MRQKKLPTEDIDEESQWDWRKLAFHFVAEKCIEFRELVRELYWCSNVVLYIHVRR
ncbi:hypothetical protein SCLCIDRAFT_1223661 [Scleroderma citrinum Foug A]|uniref:PSP1 C-terminal domain-containing protein n=1 Tax=Scleroderma citrinum Foug A TaxID=1036808 RepID=A0A0C2YS40_9AGAM|nr:hypothetical protein SCLCIDRAFT_1223661 [Scleroderma citrinum Foug A]